MVKIGDQSESLSSQHFTTFSLLTRIISLTKDYQVLHKVYSQKGFGNFENISIDNEITFREKLRELLGTTNDGVNLNITWN